MGEPIPSDLEPLATRLQIIAPRLEVLRARKPGWQKNSKTPLFLSGYSLEMRDRETSEVYIVTTDELFSAGVNAVDETQTRFLASARGRFLGMSLALLGALVLAFGSLVSGIALIPAAVLIAVGVWVWIRARRAIPNGWPKPTESMMMVLTGRMKRRG